MNQRQIDILGLVLKEYINSGVPVASETLVDKYKLDFSSATVRNEMTKLEDEEYLFQPHTSAGRVPSDKGYRFYVDYLMKSKGLSKKEEARLKEKVFDDQENSERLIHNLARTMAELSNTLVISGIISAKNFYEQVGITNLLGQFEFEKIEDIQHTLSDLEYLDKNIWELTELLNGHIKIYIGEENPLRPIKKYSTIISSYELPNDEQGFLALVGPKRMNYEKNISLIDYIINNL